MKDELEPKRWSAGGADAPEGLRQLLASGRADVGTSGEVNALRERLAQALAPQPSTHAPPADVNAASTRWAAWLAGGVGAAGLIWFFAASGDDPERPVPTEPPASVSAPPSPAQPPPAAVIETPPAPSTEPETAAAPEQRSDRASRAATKADRQRARKQAPPAKAGPGEAELLERARALLQDGRPKEALAVTDQHARRFARGVLAEEREVIAIEALARLGKSSAAKQRADRFEQRHPSSVHLEKVRSPLD